MRVIAGEAGGIPLKVPKEVTRPTSDRVREALFSILGPGRLIDARVLDLFAGSGALGIEALSRGAASALFVDSNRRAEPVIRDNLERARLSGRGRVVIADVRSYLRRSLGRGEFNLVFADPPYCKQRGDEDWSAALLALPELPSLLAPGGIFVLESEAGRRQDAPPFPWILADQRVYGSTMIRLLEPTAADPTK